MADNDIVIQSKNLWFKDRSGVRVQGFLDAPAVSAALIKASLTTSSASPAIPANTTTRRQISIVNTGTVVAEVSPTAGFVFGDGFPIQPGGVLDSNYNGAFYARVASGTGELRAWSED
jgi:hypothetical protein